MNEEGKEHRTVSRVARILNFVANHADGVRMPALVRELDAPRSSVHGLVGGLVACGYLQTTPDGYVIGPAIGALASNRRTLDEVERPVLTQLAKEVGETVMLSVRIGESIIYIDAVESEHLIRYSPQLYQQREIYPASSGKCFLAFGPADFTKTYLEKHIPASQRQQVRAELDSIVDAGYSMNRGETIPDVTAVAVPIVSQGRLIACISVAGPTRRIPAKQMPAIAERARAAAADIAKALG